MKGMLDKIWLVALAVVLAVGLVGTAGAVTFDLKADWSDTTNPNGVWSYMKGSNVLPLQTDYDQNHVYVSDQPAWADAQFNLSKPFNGVGHVPVWMRTIKDAVWGSGNDTKAGDIILHPSYDGSTKDPYGEGNVTWTSNLTGTATIHGNVWYTGQLNRSDDWTLYFNSTQLANGTVYYDDGHPRSNPYTFGDFVVSVIPGDMLTFTAFGTSGGVPYFLGVNLTIDLAPPPAPLPASALLFGSGLVGLPLLRFRQKLK